jgi:PiT family inorganic phosphate transporter
MGVIVVLLLAAGKKEWTTGGFALLGRKHDIAWWIILSCRAAMGLGTLSCGWRIV